MLYIASALTPTPVSHSVQVSNLIAPGTNTLVIAKPDRLEFWDVTATGLVFRDELAQWGTIVGMAVTSVNDARPHLLVLLGPPNARLLLVTWEDGPVVTASQALSPPMPALRRQEFFTGVISQGSLALVSLWTGLLACIEMEFEKPKDAKRRGSIQPKGMDVDEDNRRLVFKTSFNINIREHNLLDIAFGAEKGSDPPLVMFLWMSEYNKIQLQPRTFVAAQHKFENHGPPTDVVNPTDYPVAESDEIDFNEIPFSCPAGRNILPIPVVGAESRRFFLLTGDEHSVLYSVTSSPASSPRKPSVSQRASAPRRSPQEEKGGIGKKRKSSMSGKGINTDSEDKWLVQPVWRVRQGWGVVLASTVLETHPSGGSVLLGDESGKLTAIGWEFETSDTVKVGLIDLGVSSPPTALTYLDNRVVFVASACGDPTLLSLDLPQAKASPASASLPRSIKGKGRAQDSIDGGAWTIQTEAETTGGTTLLERWMNLAPVKDFAVVEEADGRVSHLVVASGSANTNTLRIVRNGLGLENLLRVEGVEGIERMWSLAPTGGPPMLLLSFASNSMVLSLEPSVSVLEVAQGLQSTSTLAAGVVGTNNLLVQVTPAAVYVWSDTIAGTRSEWGPEDDEIVAGAISGDHVAIGTRKGDIWTFHVEHKLVQKQMTPGSKEIAAIAVAPRLDGAFMVAASDWAGTITVMDGSTVPRTFQEECYAASLLIEQREDGPFRLVTGLSDGSMVTYSLEESSRPNRISTSLGTQPVQLAPLTVQSDKFEETVVAIGITERLSVIFESRGHLESSASGLKNSICAAAVNTPSLGPCLAVATSTGITFERLTSLKKLQVLTLDLGDKSATRVSYVPHLNVLAVGTISRSLDPDTGEVLQASSLELRHPTTLELLVEYALDELEAVASVNAVFVNGRQYIALGTAIFSSDGAMDESTLNEVSSFAAVDEGRLVLLEPEIQISDGEWNLLDIDVVKSTAAVFDATTIHGFLAAASATKVSIMRLQDGQLQELSNCSFAFEAHFLSVLKEKDHPDRLIVGDAMRSVIVLEIDEGSGEIHSDKRDMSSHSVRALSDIHDGGPGAVIADTHGNLLTFRLGDSLEAAATFGVREDVARLRKGSLTPMEVSDVLRSEVLFATASGRLGIIGEVKPSATRTLQDLQRNMNTYYKPSSSIDWKTYRRGGNALISRETAGFIDGDLVEKFLDMDVEDATLMLEGKNVHERVSSLDKSGRKEDASREDVIRVLEGAAALH